LKDVSFRISPLTSEDAEDMLKEVKFSDLILKGFRGQKPANKESIVNTILAVSRLMESDPKIKEIVGRDGGVLVDDETAWNEIQKLSDEKY